MDSNIYEAIARLQVFTTVKVMYGNTYAMLVEQLTSLQKDICLLLNETVLKDDVKKVIREIGYYGNMARDQIESPIVIADSDSLNFGRQQAHNKDVEVLKNLLDKR